MLAYLTLTSGARSGSNYLLDSQRENQIGRGLDCQIILTDPLSSRVHAIVAYDEDGWWARDAGSRNGTFLNGQKIDEARLVDDCVLKIGDAKFLFRTNEPRAAGAEKLDSTETIIFDTPMNSSDTGLFAAAAFRDKEQAKDLLDVYQLSILLLGCNDEEEVITTSLEVMRERSGASLVGFLVVDDEGQLRPRRVLPEAAAKKLSLSETLTNMVSRQRRGIWTSKHSGGSISDSLQHFADAICIPAIRNETMLGALHLYLEHGRFRQSDFEVAMSVANLLAIALAKAHQLASLQADNARLAAQSASSSELLGDSPPMLDLKHKIKKIARAPGAVLVRGESGCGKELVARDLHRASPRADRPMLSVNCAAIPRDLMESQLFGHKKGSFTGADSDRIGWFQQADAGTLFLDEVGEMTLDGQSKLLRILEGHPFLPVGGQTEVSVDVRVIAATNRDLREFVREGRFREDLYYRLTVFELYVPPLRDRGTDVQLLIDFFLEHFKTQHGRPDLILLPLARERLMAYNWPGNVRQLRNVIDSAVVLADGSQIKPEDLGLRDTSDELESLRIDFWERKLIKQALERTGGNIPEAARLLGIGRATLYRKVEDYGLK
ncbi:MAG: sigma 54-interacting transcriptional regulator [Planctomycetota bacterium]